MAAPCALFTSCSEYDPYNFVKEILNVEELAEGKCLLENVFAYDWSIDTKYYSAEVKLCVTKEKTIGNEEFAELLQAIILYFDPCQDSSFSQMKSWLPYIEHIDPEVKILVCDRSSDDDKVPRLIVQKWCIENGFELVELNPEPESEDSETEDDFKETTGIKRIVQALHAHTWPNLDLKDEGPAYSPYIRQLIQEEYELQQANAGTESSNETTPVSSDDPVTDCNCDNSDATGNVKLSPDIDTGDRPSDEAVGEQRASENSKEKAKKKKQLSKTELVDSMLPPEDIALFEAVGSDDPGGESFEKLFEKFASMKEKANTLPHDERKKYSEQVAVAFWRAMCGDDDDEIAGLSDNDVEENKD